MQLLMSLSNKDTAEVRQIMRNLYEGLIPCQGVCEAGTYVLMDVGKASLVVPILHHICDIIYDRSAIAKRCVHTSRHQVKQEVRKCGMCMCLSQTT